MHSTDCTPPAVGVDDLLAALREEVAAALNTGAGALDGRHERTLQERGLRSLGALRIQYRLHERLEVMVPLGDLLGAHALGDLAQQVHARLGQADAFDSENV